LKKNSPDRQSPSHRTTYRVLYGDTDKLGLAYHANYFRWFEVGRAEMFRDMGMTYKEMESLGVALPVSEVYCKFSSPVRYDDLLIIETALDKGIIGGLKFLYRILHADDETLLAEGFTCHACVDMNGRCIRPPAFLRELRKKLVRD